MSQDQKPVLDAPVAQPQAAISPPAVIENQVETINASPEPAQALPPTIIPTEEATDSHPAAVPNSPQQPPPYVEGKDEPKVVPASNPVMVTPLASLTEQTGLWIDCPHCKHRTQTKVFTEGEAMQVVCGAILCLFCICLTCVPCCAGWFERTNISCGRCNKLVAVIPSDGPIQVMPPNDQRLQPTQYATQSPPQQPMVAKPQQ